VFWLLTASVSGWAFGFAHTEHKPVQPVRRAAAGRALPLRAIADSTGAVVAGAGLKVIMACRKPMGGDSDAQADTNGRERLAIVPGFRPPAPPLVVFLEVFLITLTAPDHRPGQASRWLVTRLPCVRERNP